MTTQNTATTTASAPKAATLPLHVRQGDVLLVRVAADLSSATDLPRDGGRVILAYGEVTGHAHAIREPHAVLRLLDGRRYLDAPRPFVVEHEEHAPVSLDVGTYEIVIQREYVPGPIRSRRVVD
jgi:hypothetical protein